MNEEIAIDIKELSRRILKKWKGLVIAGLVGAVVMSVVGYGISYNKYMDGQPVSESELEKDKSNLTQKEQEKVTQAYESYKVYKKQYQADLEYNQNSLLMKIGTDNATTVELQYYIDNGYKSVYPVIEQTNNAADIIAAYSLYLTSDDVIEKIKEKTGEDIEDRYLKELIAIEALPDTQTMKISICADAEELANQIADVLEQETESYSSQLQAKYGQFEVSGANRIQNSILDESVYELQQTKIASVSTLRTQMEAIGNDFTENQKTYYEALVKNDETSDEKFEGKIISKRYIILGFALGFIVFIAYVVFRYLMQKEIRNRSDLQDLYHIYTFGVTNNKDGYESTEKIAKQIVACATTNGIHKIGLIGTDDTENTENFLKTLEKRLKNEKIESLCGVGIENISYVLQNVGSAGYVVLVERKDGSLFEDVEKEISMCEKCNIRILGNIIID